MAKVGFQDGVVISLRSAGTALSQSVVVPLILCRLESSYLLYPSFIRTWKDPTEKNTVPEGPSSQKFTMEDMSPQK